MKFFRKHLASVIMALAAVAILIALVVLVPTNSSTDISPTGIEPSGSTIDFPSDEITLTYWRTLDGAQPFNDIITDYKTLHPNVTIRLSNLADSTYDRQLTDAAKAGTLPDLFAVQNDWLPRYSSALSPAPSSVYTADEFRATFVAPAAELLSDTTKVSGLAYSVSTLGLFYNKTLFEQAGIKNPPKTWQELIDVSKKLTKRNGTTITQAGIALGDSKVSDMTGIVSTLMQQNGATMTNLPPTQAVFNLPDPSGYASAAKAVNFYTSFARSSSQVFSWSSDLGSSLDAFKAGKAAMMIDYAYRAPEIDVASPGMNYKMAALPQANPSEPINGAEFWAELVSKNSKHAEVAWDFLRFVATRTQLNRYSIATYRPAARKDLAREQQKDQYLGPFAGQSNSAKTWHKGNNYNVDGIFSDMVQAVLGGGASQAAVDTAATRTTQEIVRSK